MATSAKGRNGILPVPAAATRKSAKAEVPGRQAPKTGTARLRLIIRRLPPGLTETEFWLALGEEWKSGLTKVDWAAYKPGKVSKEYACSFEPPSVQTNSSPARRSLRSHREHI
jgi:regulator of nonsense transcripts 3